MVSKDKVYTNENPAKNPAFKGNFIHLILVCHRLHFNLQVDLV